MALIVSLTLPATTALVDGEVVDVPEITYPTAYARVFVSRVHADKSYICVCWYETVESRLANANPVKMYEFIADTVALSGDYFPAAYAFLKTQPEFDGAIDHFEAHPVQPQIVISESNIPTWMAEAGIPNTELAPTQPEAQA